MILLPLPRNYHKNTHSPISCTGTLQELHCSGMSGLDTHCPAEEMPPAQMCVGWLAAGITSPDPYRKQAKTPKNTDCSTSVFKEHPPLGAIHQPERHAKKDYLILYTDLTKNA